MAMNERETSVTVHHAAPVGHEMPRNKQIEVGEFSSPASVRYPQVRGGICEYCGVIDQSRPSEEQYKLCAHYRGMQMRCVYCPRDKDSNDVINHSVLNVADHPSNPGRLVVWCDSYECSKAHRERFSVSRS